MTLRGLHRLGKETGWLWSGGIFWFRVFGWGIWKAKTHTPRLLRPGKPPNLPKSILDAWRTNR